MRTVSLLWNPTRAFTFALCVTNICAGQRSIKNSLLAERKDWLDPSNRLTTMENHYEYLEEVHPNNLQQEQSVATSDFSIYGQTTLSSGNEKYGKPLAVCERSLSECQAQLVRYQMAADATNNGELTTDMVYLRKWLKSIMARLEGGYLNQKDTPARMELSFSANDVKELRTLLSKVDARSASRISSKMEDLVVNAEVQFDYRERPSKVQLLWCSVCDLVSQVNLLFVIRIGIVASAILFVLVIVRRRRRILTYGYGLFCIFWVSYFWHWQKLIKRSEADLYVMNRKNPCEDTRPWYNLERYFSSGSRECEKYIRKQFTPTHMEYSPMEVLLHMVFEYSSRAISVGITHLLSGLGAAIREFSDEQSWFSFFPAFFLLFAVLMTFAFKASGMVLSLYGLRVEASDRYAPRSRPIASLRRDDNYGQADELTVDDGHYHVGGILTAPECLIDSSTSTVSHNNFPRYSSASSSGFIEMPPPSNTSVPRRMRKHRAKPNRSTGDDAMLIRKRKHRMAAGDGFQVSDYNRDEGDDDDYHTATDDNDE